MGTLGIIKKSNDASISEESRNAAAKYAELTLDGLGRRKGRRFIKAHLPISLMPPQIFEVGAKIIYCARNPKDVLVSGYNALFFFIRKNREEYSFRQYFEDVRNDKFYFCPFFEHVKEGWARRNDKNVLFLFYEDTIKDKKQTMIKVANFIGKKLSNDNLESLEDHLSFDKFKKNSSVNCDHLVEMGVAGDNNTEFIRKGKSGGWRDYFVGDLERDVDEWMKMNLANTDLKFPDV